MLSSVIQLCSTLCYLIDCSPLGSSVHGILQARILLPFPHFLLQGIFPTQGSNPHLHCRRIIYYWATREVSRVSITRGTGAKKISLDMIPGIGTYRKGPTQKQKIVHLKIDQGTQMLIEALFRIVKMWQQHRYPSINEWVNKLWYIHITEYYSASKEVLIHATTGMNLENIILNQRSQS